MPPRRRAVLHRRAAELLEPLAIGRDERAGAVAQHWDRAGEPGRAVQWSARAADAARAAGAHDEAVRYLAFALEAMDRGAGDGEIHVDRAELPSAGATQRTRGSVLKVACVTFGSFNLAAVENGEFARLYPVHGCLWNCRFPSLM